MIGGVTRLGLPTWGPPPSRKQALNLINFNFLFEIAKVYAQYI